jgi:diguanylate cyclase (GGDEF)-like protein/PAS domain S-box-containing protein
MTNTSFFWLIVITAAILGAFLFLRPRRRFEISSITSSEVMDEIEGLAIILDQRGTIIEFNRAAQMTCDLSAATLGTTPDLLSKPWADLFQLHPEASFKGEVIIDLQNSPRHYNLTISPIQDRQNQTHGRLFLLHDITESKLAEQARAESEARYQQLIRLLPDGIITHLDGKIQFVNSAAIELIGATSAGELIGKNFLDLVHPDSHELVFQRMQKSLKDKTVNPLVNEKFLRLDGKTIDVEVVSRTIKIDGSTTFLAVFRDITERKNANERLQQLSRAVEQSPASIVITNTDGIIEYVNPRFTQVTGYTSEEVLGKNPRILSTDQTPRGTHRDLWSKITVGREWQGEFVNRKKNGELYYESAIISPILDANGVTTHYLAVKEDITERKRAEDELHQANQKLQFQLEAIQLLQAELREQAIRDPLTGLYNRRYLNETLERELARATRENYPISFIMNDIDRFKIINDTFGHPVGDIFLQHLAAELTSHARVGDIICRYGGEEFLVILPGVSTNIAHQIAERSRKSFQELRVEHGGFEIRATLSSGIAAFPEHATKSMDLIALADQAMYQAKSDGRNRVVISQIENLSNVP